MQPLEDITVIDLTLTLPGPYATSMLEQMGADVVSIEPPGGDAVRHWEPALPEGHSEMFAMLQEGKTSVSLDLKDDRGRELLADIAGNADVLVEGFRPGVVDDLGIGPGTLREENPDLVYASLSGFGQTGPRAQQPGHSVNYEGLAGMIDPENPSLPGYPIADFAGAQMLVVAILAAIRKRDRGGGGQYIDLGMYEVLASWNRWNAPWANDDDSPDHQPLTGGEYPCYNTYETGDGRYLTLGVMEPHFWETLCDRVGRPDLVDTQFETGGKDSDVYHELQTEFRKRPLSEWLDELADDLPVGPVRSPKEALSDPQLDARGHGIALDESTARVAQKFDLPVELGSERGDDVSDESDVFAAAGYDGAKLAALRDAGVLSGDEFE